MTANLPATFTQGPSNKFKAVAQRASLAEGIGQSYGVIGYRGKTWSLRYRGEEYNILRADGTPSGVIDVVILRSAPVKSKSYYKDWKPGDSSPPICSSLDGVLPDDGVTTKQSETCALCPRNEWKVNAEGRKGRECSDYKRLAVLVMPEYTAPVLNDVPLVEPVFLRVPAASLNDLATFGEEMEAKGFDFSSFITRIKFDPDKSHPQFIFEALRPLSDPEADVIIPLIDHKQALRVTGEDQLGGHKQIASTPARVQLAPPDTTAASPPLTAPAAPASPTPSVQIIPPTPALSLVAAVKPAPTLLTLTPTPPPAQAAVQTAGDTGTVAAAGEDLDARVARLLNTAKS